MVTARHQESTSFSSLCGYDVAIFSRGKYVEKPFLDLLYDCFVHEGFRPFREDEDLPEMGENIRSDVQKAIRKARASVILCSKDDSSSQWFVDELIRAFECHSNSGHVVRPVLYDLDFLGRIVQSSYSRNEITRLYRDDIGAFLTEISPTNDPYLLKGSTFAQKIVEDVAEKLRTTLLGSPPRQFGAEDIQLIAGLGGIGKTTLAKHLFDSNYEKFEGSSFVPDICRTLLQHHDGLVRLRKQLLSNILKEEGLEVPNVDVLKSKIKSALRCKKLLIVLDDVDHPYQLDGLLGGHSTFCPGSKIIVTSRNKHLLKGYESYGLYKVEQLNEDESLELLRRRAFGQNHSVEGYEPLLRRLLQQCSGVPLFITVLGSSLYRRGIFELQRTVQRFDGVDDDDDSSARLLTVGYDIFLIFSDEFEDDTCKTFPYRLFAALEEAGFHTFKDDQKIEDREEALKQIIQHSKCCIIILSRDYASSKRRLDELVMIVDLFSTSPHRILPVYYDVEKSDVMHQLGSLRAPFSAYEKEIEDETDDEMKGKLRDDVRRWRAALKHVAKLPGFNFPNVGSNGNELEVVPKIVEDVAEELHHIVLGGLPQQLRVDDGSRDGGVGDVQSFGGVGNTTLAKRSDYQNFEVSSVDDDIYAMPLKVCYDLLGDEEKDLFLDIACFFVGEDKDCVATILEGCGFYAEIGIRTLIDRSLLTVNEDNKLMMHRLVQDMGREIVRQESPLEPSKRSRLWRREDSSHVLLSSGGGRTMGTEAIEGLALEFRASKYEESCCLGLSSGLLPTMISSSSSSSSSSSLATKSSVETTAFSNMRNLRLLKLRDIGLTGGYEDFPKNLRWLSWRGLSMPPAADIPMENLVALELQHCTFRQLWSGTKTMPRLELLDISHCHGLAITPDLSGLSKLEILILEDCINLVELHESVVKLERLRLLNLKGCTNLVKLTAGVARKLKSIEQLLCTGCPKLF